MEESKKQKLAKLAKFLENPELALLDSIEESASATQVIEAKMQINEHLGELKNQASNLLDLISERAEFAKGESGYTPQKNVDYFDGEPGPPGKDADLKETAKLVLSKIRVPEDGKIGPVGPKGEPGSSITPDTPEQIATKLNTLDGKIDFKILRDVPKLFEPHEKRIKKLEDGGLPPVVWRGGGGNSITLQTNGVNNSDQTLLNLIAGTNITLTPDGAGGVTIDGAAGGGESLAQTLAIGNTTGGNDIVVSTGDIIVGQTSVQVSDSGLNNYYFAGPNYLFQQYYDGVSSTDFLLQGNGTQLYSDTAIDIQTATGLYGFFSGAARNGIFNFTSVATSDKTYTWPNKSGTVAMTSDIAITAVSDTNTIDLTLTGTTLSADLRYIDSATINFSDSGAGFTGITIQQMSITADASGLKLSGDATTPGNNRVYSTDGTGTKGWNTLAAIGGGDVVGPASAVDGQAAVFNGVTGKIIKTFVPTAGSVLFAGTSGILAEDNSNFFWNDSTNRLGIQRGGAAPTSAIHVGPNASQSVDAGIVIARDIITGAGLTNGHAFSDSSQIDRTGATGNTGYNSFDARVVYTGSAHYDHNASFQALPTLSSFTGLFDDFYNQFNGLTFSGAGTVTNFYGAYYNKPSLSAGAVITNAKAIYISNWNGVGSTSSYALYSDSVDDSYFAGNVSIGVGSAGQSSRELSIWGSAIEVYRASNSAIQPAGSNLRKSRGTVSVPLTVANGDSLGAWIAEGYDGSAFSQVGFTAIQVDNTVSAGVIPTRWVLWTANASGVETEVFRASHLGAWGIGGANYGTAGQVFTSAGSSAPPTWTSPSTSIAIGSVITGGTANRVLYENASNLLDEDAAFQFAEATNTLTLGEVGNGGEIALLGGTSGTVTLQTAATAGTWTLTLPVDDGAANQFLQTDGNGVTSWATAYFPGGTDVPLADGGTGASLSDPGANRLWGWDDTDNAINFWNIGSGLIYTHSTHTLSVSPTITTKTIYLPVGASDRVAGLTAGTLGEYVEFASTNTAADAMNWAVDLPGDYAGGTITATIHAYVPAGAVLGTVFLIGVKLGAFADGSTDAATYGTAQTITTTPTVGQNYIKTTAAITSAGSPAAGQTLGVQFYRDSTGGFPVTQFAGKLRVYGITLTYTYTF